MGYRPSTRWLWLGALTACFGQWLPIALPHAEAATFQRIYRSVGAATALATGAANSMSVTGSIVKFTSPVPSTVGVGDALQYLSSGGAINAIAFISYRYSSTEFLLRKADGTSATATSAATTNWSLFRAYTSIANAEAGTENSNIHANVIAFDGANQTLTGASPKIWSIALYADAEDTTGVTFSGWTTSAAYYVRLFAPTESWEVGTPQGHSGYWDNTKSRIVITSGPTAAITIQTLGARIDGLQIQYDDNTNAGVAVSIGDPGGNSGEIVLERNLIRTRTTGAASYSAVSVNTLTRQSTTIRLLNNVIYDCRSYGFVDATNQMTAGASYLYNNTVYGCAGGIATTGGTARAIYAKNNIVQGATTGYAGSFNAASATNLSNDATATTAGASSFNSKSVTFNDAANGDLRVLDDATNQANIKAKGTDISTDAQAATELGTHFATDVSRSYRVGGFDLGAAAITRASPTHIYRSVGPGSTTALATGAANAMTIAGSTATFSTGLLGKIGVGDAIVYNSDGAIAFVHGRTGTTSTTYTVKSASGGTPTAATGDTTWSIYRSYTSLSDAETGAENAGIPLARRDFDTWQYGKDLVITNEVWHIACYGDAPDTTRVDVDGWFGSPSHYLRIFTPYLSTDVGTSQRHSGKFETSKYHLTRAATGSANFVSVNSDFVRAEGLQIYEAADDFASYIFNFQYVGLATRGSDNRISHSIMRGPGAGSTWSHAGIFFSSGDSNTEAITTFRAWNNVVYGVSQGGVIDGSYSDFGYMAGLSEFYNNTIYNATNVNYTFSIGSRPGSGRSVRLIGNICNGCAAAGTGTESYSGNYLSGTNYNIDKPLSTAPGANSRQNKTVLFADSANGDFHLHSTDTEAKGRGTDLSADVFWPFADDIDSTTRTGTWDIGADGFGSPAITLVSVASANVTNTAFDIQLTYTGDTNNDAVCTLDYCNATDNPACTVTGSVSMGSTVTSPLTKSVSGLATPNDPGDTIKYSVNCTDAGDGGATGGPLTGQLTLTGVNNVTVGTLAISSIANTSFTISVPFSGDSNASAACTAVSCDATASASCTPSAANTPGATAWTLARGAGVFSVSATGYTAGKTYKVTSNCIDTGDTLQGTASQSTQLTTTGVDAATVGTLDIPVPSITGSGFTATIPYTGDSNYLTVPASCSLVHCNATTNPACTPNAATTGGSALAMTRTSGTFTLAVGSLANTVGDTYKISVTCAETMPDALGGTATQTAQVTLAGFDNATVGTLSIPSGSIANTSFTISVPFSGDSNYLTHPASCQAVSCDATASSSCTPSAPNTPGAAAHTLTRGAGAFSGSATGYTSGKTYKVSVTCAESAPDTLQGTATQTTTVTTSGVNGLTLTAGITTSSVTFSGFSVSVPFSGDSDLNASCSLYRCNQTDHAGCDPTNTGLFGASTALTRGAGVFTGSVASLAAPDDGGDTLNLIVSCNDGGGSTAQTTVALAVNNDLQMIALTKSNATYDSFDASMSFTGDQDNDATCKIQYCNQTQNAACVVGNDVALTKSGTHYAGSVTSVSLAGIPGDVLKLQVSCTGGVVTGGPINSTLTIPDTLAPSAPTSFGFAD